MVLVVMEFVDNKNPNKFLPEVRNFHQPNYIATAAVVGWDCQLFCTHRNYDKLYCTDPDQLDVQYLRNTTVIYV